MLNLRTEEKQEFEEVRSFSFDAEGQFLAEGRFMPPRVSESLRGKSRSANRAHDALVFRLGHDESLSPSPRNGCPGCLKGRAYQSSRAGGTAAAAARHDRAPLPFLLTGPDNAPMIAVLFYAAAGRLR